MSSLNEHLQLRHASEPLLNMDINGNGILDHFSSSPVSAPTSQHNNDIMHSFYSNFKQHQIQRAENDQLFERFWDYSLQTQNRLQQENDELRTRLKEAGLDLTDATKSRRELQQHVEQLEAQLSRQNNHVEYLKNCNPYVVILIDGDGCHFQQRFIEQGIDGGKQAAYALRHAVLRDCLSQNGPGSVQVTARFIANLSGLAYITKASGTVDSEATVRQFTSGFTQAMASFDFIDVGSGKERADTKIKEAIRWHLKDHNCKQIVVAISFDSGYASFLDDVLPDDASRQRITVLEGPPSHRDIAAHRLRTVNLNEDVLRADKLEVLSYQNQNQGYIDRRLSNAPMTITPPATIAGMSPLPPPPALPSTTPATTNGGGQILPPSSYATAIKAASPPPQVTLPIPIKTKTSKTPARQATKTPQWNPGARGLDSPLEVHQPSLDNIKKRKDNSKLCNNHYLRGPCAKGDACCFEHNYRASEQEKVAIAFLARQNPCTSGQDCDVKDCIYGHHCPSTNNGQCTHSYCKFRPSEHPPNTKFRPTYQYFDEV